MRGELLKNVDRIVVKLGTGVLTDSRKQTDLAQMEQLTAQIAEQCQAGREMVIVTSGAVGAGMGALGYKKRPGQLAELQACAAVGQSRLMATYEKLFAKHGLHVAQVLLTHEDLQDHERHLNARNTLVKLFKHGCLMPIINENDASFVHLELKFGDNDKLSIVRSSSRQAAAGGLAGTSDDRVDGVIENFRQSIGAHHRDDSKKLTRIWKALPVEPRARLAIGGNDVENPRRRRSSHVQAFRWSLPRATSGERAREYSGRRGGEGISLRAAIG